MLGERAGVRGYMWFRHAKEKCMHAAPLGGLQPCSIATAMICWREVIGVVERLELLPIGNLIYFELLPMQKHANAGKCLPEINKQGILMNLSNPNAPSPKFATLLS
jgi:hypothetical protein